MDKKTIERIEKINTMDTEILPIVLIRGQELFWTLHELIEENIDATLSRVSSNKKKLKIINEQIRDFGQQVSDDYLEYWSDDLFAKEIMKYLGFDVRDEVTDGIIFEYCNSTDKNKNINWLKEKLIKAAIESDGVDEEAEFKAQEEYDESGGRVYKGVQLSFE